MAESMIDEKKMAQRLKVITIFFFLQPILALTNSNSYNNLITLGALIFWTVLWITVGFCLKQKKQWARIMGVIAFTVQGVASIAVSLWFPSYFKETIKDDSFLWLILLAEGVILLSAFAYFAMAWRLNTKEMKEYFAMHQKK